MLDGSTVGRGISISVAYDRDDALLYNAAIGGDPISTPQLVVERLGPVVAPTYAAVLGFRAFRPLFAELGIDEAKMLHLSQSVAVERPLDPAARLSAEAAVTELWDKGSAAIISVEARLSDGSERVASTVGTLFVKGAGGFDGESGPGRDASGPPDRRPDAVGTETVALNQTAVYRMCGDDNPLHVDPEVAAGWGFDAPIAHGLWTFAASCRRAVCAHAGGEFERISRVSGEFAGPLFLGETTRLSSWADEGEIVGELATAGGETVLRNLKVEFGR